VRFLTFVFLCAAAVWAQANPEAAKSAPPAAANPSATEQPAKTLTVPVGTKVPLSLKQAISTKNARQGDPVYAETAFPVAIGGRMVIPAGTYVQGVIDRVHRPGRVKGKAEILMHFTSLVFPNGYTVVMPAGIENVPGAEHEKVKGQEGTIQGEGNRGEKVKTAAGTAATGAVIGAATTGSGKGAGIGGGIGGAAGLAIAMLSRGPDVRLLPGTSLEMVIQRPLTIDATRVHAPAE
jgi:type IV secretion system protein VirB10